MKKVFAFSGREWQEEIQRNCFHAESIAIIPSLRQSIKGSGIHKVIKIMMLIHGLAAPFGFGALLIKPLFVLSSTVAITYPAIGIFVSIYMWRTRNGSK